MSKKTDSPHTPPPRRRASRSSALPTPCCWSGEPRVTWLTYRTEGSYMQHCFKNLFLWSVQRGGDRGGEGEMDGNSGKKAAFPRNSLLRAITMGLRASQTFLPGPACPPQNCLQAPCCSSADQAHRGCPQGPACRSLGQTKKQPPWRSLPF